MLQITFTDRFQKHYKNLTDIEKKQFKKQAVDFCGESDAPVFACQADTRYARFV